MKQVSTYLMFVYIETVFLFVFVHAILFKKLKVERDPKMVKCMSAKLKA